LLPSVAQPPLPLQEFLPLQPASLVLQPPWPLQSFWPLHACLPFSASAMVCVETPAWLDMLAAYARAASDPLKRPAANAVLLKLILLLTGALYVPEEFAQEIDGVLVVPRLPSAKKYTAATRNSPAIGERKNVPFPLFFSQSSGRVANRLISACISARKIKR